MASTYGTSATQAAIRRGVLRLIEPKAEPYVLLAILSAAAFARTGIALLFPPQEFYLEDSDSYMRSAQDILAGRHLQSLLVMPGYPTLLALAGANPVSRLCIDILLSVVGVSSVSLRPLAAIALLACFPASSGRSIHLRFFILSPG